jgi:hypothetical protein
MVARRVTSLVAADNSDDGDVVDPIPSSSRTRGGVTSDP